MTAFAQPPSGTQQRSDRTDATGDGPGRAAVMTIGTLSRRTGVPVKQLREYADQGLIYTVGRSPGNYRLFGDEALWCVRMINGFRGLGLTVAEMRELTERYLHGEQIGPRVAEVLAAVRHRTTLRIEALHEQLARLDRFEADNAAELAGRADFRAYDPRDAA
jgi:DNA-binding transcriptional MerR regulator